MSKWSWHWHADDKDVVSPQAFLRRSTTASMCRPSPHEPRQDHAGRSLAARARIASVPRADSASSLQEPAGPGPGRPRGAAPLEVTVTLEVATVPSAQAVPTEWHRAFRGAPGSGNGCAGRGRIMTRATRAPWVRPQWRKWQPCNPTVTDMTPNTCRTILSAELEAPAAQRATADAARTGTWAFASCQGAAGYSLKAGRREVPLFYLL